MRLANTAACAEASKPGAVGAGEKPKPGRSGATMCKAGKLSFGGFGRLGMTFSHSRLVDGQP